VSANYDFVTDRLAIGDVASRATPGFVAVVSLLATAPWDEQYGAPAVPDGVPVHMIDLRDGEKGLEAHLDAACAFIAEHITKGCVLVHCGVGLSRSVSVVAAYLCRYAGMSLSEAVNFIKAMRQGACPADIFWAAITQWLHLDVLGQGGPRKGSGDK
jgi:protein-tyrosine phosphatase